MQCPDFYLVLADLHFLYRHSNTDFPLFRSHLYTTVNPQFMNLPCTLLRHSRWYLAHTIVPKITLHNIPDTADMLVRKNKWYLQRDVSVAPKNKFQKSSSNKGQPYIHCIFVEKNYPKQCCSLRLSVVMQRVDHETYVQVHFFIL